MAPSLLNSYTARLGLLGGAGWLLAACEAPPTAQFLPFEPATPRNLTEVLGTAGQLIGPDTISFVVRYNPKTNVNSFLMVNAPDTVPWFSAKAFRYRGLYYLITPGRTAAGAWIHAARITGRTVQGLGTDYNQMADISSAVATGKFAELVQGNGFSGDSIVLRYDRAALHRFYRTLPDSFPQYRIVTARATAPIQPNSPTPSVEPAFSVYPNPASEEVTLGFSGPAPRTIRILDHAGRPVQVLADSAASITLPLRAIKAGAYRIHVTTPREPATSSRALLVVK